MNGLSYVKVPLRKTANVNIEIKDKHCFLWSLLTCLQLCNSNDRNTVSNYRQFFSQFSIQSFDYTNGFKYSDIHKIIELNDLSINKFELNFYQDMKKWRHKLVPIEVNKNDSDRVLDLAVYRDHYVPNKKLNVILGDHNKTFICRRCLISYTSEDIIMLYKQKCGDDNTTTIRTSPESHLHWRKHFHKNPLYFRVYANFEADKETDNSSVGNKTTNL